MLQSPEPCKCLFLEQSSLLRVWTNSANYSNIDYEQESSFWHLVYVPDGSKLQKIEKMILPQPSSPHLSFPPPSAPFLLCMCIYPYPLTNTHRFPPSDLLSRHLCSCLSPAGCSIALNLGIFQKRLCICLQVQNCPRHQQKPTRKMQMGHRCYYTDRA